MQILDLSYLEKISESNLILGCAGATATGQASATGTLPKTYVFTEAFAKRLQNGGAVAVGAGVAIAIGSNAKASVTVAGEGDLVIEINGSKHLVSKNAAVAFGIVIAIDLPAY